MQQQKLLVAQGENLDALVSKSCTDTNAICAWLAELGISTTPGCDIWHELSNGVLVLDVIEKMRPGTVNWSSVVRPKPTGKSMHLFQKLANCTMASELLHRHLPGLKLIEAGDFLDQKKKQLEVVVRELMRWTLAERATSLP